MPLQLLPSPDLDHPLPETLSMQQRVAVWLDLLDSSEQMLLAGLRITLPPGADVQQAAQEIYRRQSDDHYQSLLRIAEHFAGGEGEHGCAGGA